MNKIPSLNGLRAISILFVWLTHFNHFFHIINISPKPVFIDGYFGVNVFFVISGFLITTLLLNEEQRDGSISLKRFYFRRTMRIFPAYYFLLFCYLILTTFHIIQISRLSWLTAITYTKDINLEDNWYTKHLWSLSVEEQFYLLWPPAFLFFKKLRNTILLVVIFLVPAFKVYTNYHPISWIDGLTIFYRIDSIALGCLVALNREMILKPIQPFLKFLFFFSLFTIAVLPYIGTEWNIKYHLHIGFLVTAFFSTYSTVANIAIVCIMLYSVYGEKGIWFKFLNTRVMNQIGIWSYSMYLWQQLFFIKTDYWYNQPPYNIALAFAASLASYYMVEKPFLNLRERLKKLNRSKKIKDGILQGNHMAEERTG